MMDVDVDVNVVRKTYQYCDGGQEIGAGAIAYRAEAESGAERSGNCRDCYSLSL